MEPIETERLVVRNFRPDDWEALHEMIVEYQASEWAKYEDPWPTSTEELKSIAEWFASGDDYLAVCLEATGHLIGFVAVERRKEVEERVHNLGYVLHPDHQGRGYATEACRAAMDHVFGQLGALRILTGTHPANEPSVRLLRRLGLKAIDGGEFVISREEWLALGLVPSHSEGHAHTDCAHWSP